MQRKQSCKPNNSFSSLTLTLHMKGGFWCVVFLHIEVADLSLAKHASVQQLECQVYCKTGLLTLIWKSP